MEEFNSKNKLPQKRVDPMEIDIDAPVVRNTSVAKSMSLLPVTIFPERLDYIDVKTVSPKFYNSFNFSKLSANYGTLNVTLGITSANKQEGKTLVASNMGVSLAKAYKRRTVLVDLNFNNPQLHKVFGARVEPGVIEAMKTGTLRLVHSRVDNLYLLTAGDSKHYTPGINDTMALRQILYSLKKEFDFIIVDMGSVLPISDFPVHFLNEVDGLVSVINIKKTKKEELKKMYHHVDENRFVGYIFNRVDDDVK